MTLFANEWNWRGSYIEILFYLSCEISQSFSNCFWIPHFWLLPEFLLDVGKIFLMGFGYNCNSQWPANACIWCACILVHSLYCVITLVGKNLCQCHALNLDIFLKKHIFCAIERQLFSWSVWNEHTSCHWIKTNWFWNQHWRELGSICYLLIKLMCCW